MSQWHYIVDGHQHGPISFEELKSKVAAGGLTRTSLVWKIGTKDWAAVQDFPELVAQVQTPPPLPKSVTIAASSRSVGTAVADALPALFLGLMVGSIAFIIAMASFPENTVMLVAVAAVSLFLAAALIYSFQPVAADRQHCAHPSHAWRRFLAKVLDFEVASLAGLISVAVIAPESKGGFVTLFAGAAIAVWFFFEVPMEGKSLGRYLFGVQLSPVASAEVSPDYFSRFLKLSFFGMALGIPVISAIASSFAYKRLRETGTTKWDDGQFMVSFRQGIGLPLVGMLLLFVLAGVHGVMQNVMAAKQASGDNYFNSAANDYDQRIYLSFTGRSWIEISDVKGKILISGEQLPDSEISIEGRPPFEFVIGNPSKVNVIFSGRLIDLTPYTRSEIARFSLQ
jgi:hypothetical protein